MYVVCHKCAAAYQVEDGLIVRGDERAQCPNCLHVQALAEPKVEPPPPTLFRRPRSPAARKAVAPEFRVPSIPPVAPPPPPEEIGEDGVQNGAAEQLSEGAVCRECGAQLADAFDQALGICEACRTNIRPAPTPVPRIPQPIDRERTVSYSEKQQQLSDVQEELAAGLFENADDSPAPDGLFETADDSAAPGSDAPGVSTPEKPNPEHLPAVEPPSLMNAALRSASRWRPGRLFGVMAAIAVVAFAGAALLRQRRAPPKAKAPEKVRLSPRLEKTREQWARSFAETRGDPIQYLKEADLELAKDTASGYASAEKSFQKAFVLPADGSRALAGYLQAVAWGRGKSVDAQELDELTDLAEAAELQWGRSARILLAHASLALLRPKPKSADRARAFAEEALGLAGGPEKALAHLVLSSAFLSSSAELAIQNADLALKLDPALRRAYVQRAAARESLGDYRSAIADLQSRLSMEPGEQSEAKEWLARIYQEVGEWPLADALYRPADTAAADLPALTARAVIQYQSARKPQAAAQALAEGIRLRGESASPAALVDAWVHLAAADRLSGKAAEASKAANQALAISSSDAAAHLQLFLVALSLGSLDAAQPHWKAFRGRIGDPALEKLLEGRLSMAAHREAEAMRSFADAAQLDARRLDALLLAGAAAASAGRRDDALRYLVLAGQMDPTRTAPSAIGARFYLTAEENLTGAEGRVIRLAKGSTDVTPRLYEALIRFHQRDLRAADKLLQQVVDVDTGNALAHALRALIALDLGSPSRARTAAGQAAAVGRGIAIAHYAYGRALAKSGKSEDARAEFRQAEALAPGLLAAQLELAQLEAKKASAEVVRARLLHVLRVDPSYLAAKRALYALER